MVSRLKPKKAIMFTLFTSFIVFFSKYTEIFQNLNPSKKHEKSDFLTCSVNFGSFPVNIALQSFPGSGNTWVRYLIEQSFDRAGWYFVLFKILV